MNPIESIKTCFRKYAVFSGRASRPEYWWFFLFQAVASLISRNLPVASLTVGDVDLEASVLEMVVALLLLLPGLAVFVRRLHDTGRSAWWLLLGVLPLLIWFSLLFIPSVGLILFLVWIIPLFCCGVWILVLMALRGDDVSNRYGPAPYGAG